MYGEVLRTYDIDPLANLVSPPLAAATGVLPLTILSVYVYSLRMRRVHKVSYLHRIPDIMAHYAECIVRAEKEVFFATSTSFCLFMEHLFTISSILFLD